MGNQQTSSGKKKRSSVLPSSSAVMSAIEVTEHNHFHAGGDGEGNPFEKYIYPFENLVFEGAGNRLLAYCGAVWVLEEAGIWSQIKRLAGSNTGAIMAALLGVGYKSHDIQQFFSKSVQSIFEDHNLGCCGCCGLLSRLRNEYGCSSGKKLNKWIGKKMENATGTANITFQQVYDRFGKEICIAATNVNQQITEYCHVKTTPSMPVRVAVCMSLAIPGVFQPVKYKRYSHVDHYVDGGLLCNYPIDCFDGWWLSMEKNDSFLKKLQPLSDLPRLMDKRSRFSTYNEKTMGFVLFSEKEPDAMQTILDDREGKILSSDDPSTKLSRKVIPRIIARREAANQHDQFVMSSRRFLQVAAHEIGTEQTMPKLTPPRVLDESSLSQMEAISIKDLQKALQKKTDLSSTDLEQIFGLTTTSEDIFRILNKSDKQWVTYNELVKFLEEKSAKLYSSFLQENSRDTLDLASYVRSIRDSFHTNTRRHFVEKRDLERTVGINTYYVGSRDFKLEKGDIDMLLEQGRRATLSYLLYFVTHRHAPLKTKDPRLSFCPDDSLPFYIDDEVPSEIIDENDYAEQFLVVPHS